MNKVGLITYYGENYGGMLQAYALQKCVNELGYDCKLVSNEFLFANKTGGKKASITSKIKRILKNPYKSIKKSYAMRKSAFERSLNKQKFREFRELYLEIDDTGYHNYEQYVSNPPMYDTYLCGSDQIWNPNLYNENGFYFADFAPENATRISYASSVGVSTVTEEQADFMKPFLDKMDVLSTRETSGSKIVAGLTGKEVRTVIDPTLLLNAEQWSDVASGRLIDGDYVFFYFFSERDYIKMVKQKIKKLTGIKTVCIPYVAREIIDKDIKIFDAGPAEFISLIKNASLVVTDSFHATAFSINLKVPFLSLCRFGKDDSESMNSRLDTLLGALDLKERLIEKDDVITKNMLFDVDFDSVHEKLDRLREQDRSFLEKSLKYQRN